MKNYIVLLGGIFLAFHTLAQDPTIQCATELKADSRVQILADKLVFDETKWQSLEVLANKSKPTAKEKIALSVFAAESERCLELGADWRLKTYPAAINTLINNFRVESVTALSDLYGGNISYGDLARFRVKKMNELKNSMEAVNRDIQAQKEIADKQREEALVKWAEKRNQDFQANRQAELQQEQARQQQQQQQELARRQAITAQIQQNIKAQQEANDAFLQKIQTPRPQTTNCTRYGNSVSCTSN